MSNKSVKSFSLGSVIDNLSNYIFCFCINITNQIEAFLKISAARELITLKNKISKILVVDDETSIRRILATSLSMVGYEVVTAADGLEALDIFHKEIPDLVVLDVMLPKLDGYGVCQQLRQESNIPIIMLTALGDVADRLMGLEIGADDYLSKPFSLKELEARICALLRRVEKPDTSGMPNSGVVNVGTLQIDTNKRQVYKENERIRLTGREFSLLEMLVSCGGRTVSRSEIIEKVWSYNLEQKVDTRIVDVHISRLRSNLEKDPKNPELILTARGIGYLFPRLVQLAST